MESRMNLWATKSIATLRAEADQAGEHQLKRALTPLNLITLGIGAIIGAGIFVLTGQAAAQYAGPAVWISMILVGIACAFAGLCYAEMASAVPVAGSAYTYSYATMGELIAWIIGWDLVLEYAAGAATVGVGWSGHFVSLLGNFGLKLPAGLTAAPTTWCTAANVQAGLAGCAHTGLNLTGAIVNLPAVFVVALMSTILVIGIKESAKVNNFIVLLKLTIIFLIVAVGLTHITAANWKPLIPPNTGEWGTYGISGILRGAGLVFFAYIGFAAVSTAAPDARNPHDDLPVRRGGPRDRALAAAAARAAREHRHPARVRPGVRRRVDFAQEAARPRPAVPDAMGAVRADRRRGLLPRADGDAPGRYLDPADCLAADRIHHLLWIQPQTQPPPARAGGWCGRATAEHGWEWGWGAERPAAAPVNTRSSTGADRKHDQRS